MVVAAHGSWERGELPSHLPKRRAPSDLLGFKAHFRDAALAPDLMPLLAFPGGYGGMVWADEGRLSLSCCLRRDALETIRRPGESAGDAVARHLAAVVPGRRARCCGRRSARGAVAGRGADPAGHPRGAMPTGSSVSATSRARRIR